MQQLHTVYGQFGRLNKMKKVLIATTIGLLLSACSAAPKWTDPITAINGTVPDGELLPLQDTVKMLETETSDGMRLIVMKGTRKAGTRVGIHIHKYGGHTCVLSGNMTDFVEGSEPSHYPTGTCYYMPADTPMAAANLGEEDAVLVDTFILPYGEDEITILEPNWRFE